MLIELCVCGWQGLGERCTDRERFARHWRERSCCVTAANILCYASLRGSRCRHFAVRLLCHLVLVPRRVVCALAQAVTDNSPRGATTRPRPLDAPRYTVSIMSIISCLSVIAQLLVNVSTSLEGVTYILLLLPVPKSIMMCLFLGDQPSSQTRSRTHL